MGGNESSVSNSSTPFSTDVYMPVVGSRMSDQKIVDQLRKVSIGARSAVRTHIVRTAFTGIWSIVVPETGLFPCPRTGHFYCSSQDLHIAVCGFGVTHDELYLDDIWKLDVDNMIWSRIVLSGTPVPPRVGAQAIIVKNILYLFGGFKDPIYYNDLFSIDLNTGFTSRIDGSGSIPSPRSGGVIGFLNNEIYIWGGYDGLWPSDLHVFNIESFNWTSYPQEVQGRTGIAFSQYEGFIFCYGSAKTGGLIQIDMPNRQVSLIQTTGSEPPSSIVNASMIHFDKYLVLIGGKAQNEWSLIYACDIEKKWWFVWHVLPDGETVTDVDGSISDLGLFMLPRTHSMGVAYSENKRQIIAFLGYPMKEPSPLFILSVGEALGVLHMRTDMLSTLQPRQ